MYYTKEQIEQFDNQQFAFVKVKEESHVFTVTLNRPKQKNALHPVMINELAFAFAYAHYTHTIWAVVLQAEGDVFCAGADLKAFMGQVGEHNSSIPNPEKQVLIGELFRTLHKPCLAQVDGNVYAGGLLLLCGCTHVVASNQIKIGLPEVKRGLFPYQVMASLLDVMPARKVIDWCMTGNDLSAAEAAGFGIITHLVNEGETDKKLGLILATLLANSPTAIRMGLAAYAELKGAKAAEQHQYLMSMLMKTIQTQDAREGIKAFKEKRAPKWLGM